MEIVVCKKFRLIEVSKGKFVVSKMRKELRSAVKIRKVEMEAYNNIAKQTGVIYEEDKKATAERLAIIKEKNEKK